MLNHAESNSREMKRKGFRTSAQLEQKPDHAKSSRPGPAVMSGSSRKCFSLLHKQPCDFIVATDEPV
uniref:Uncharacterized protein n=2 Tax=Musa acuminata subsp. malaccensis TaxID=214687 RepID=A0A804L5B2_MUSAM